MEEKLTRDNQPGMVGSTDEEGQILFISPDIISWELPEGFIDGYETGVAGFTEDISRFFYPDSDQQQKFDALRNLIFKRIDDFQAEKGVRSVMSIGDKDKIWKVLNPLTLHLYDSTSSVFVLDFVPICLHSLIGRFSRILRPDTAFIMPVRTFFWPGSWKNVIRLTFDIRGSRPNLTNFRQAMHELIHHAEFEHMLHKNDNHTYTAYKERNATFWDYQLYEVFEIVGLEEILMDNERESEWYIAFVGLIDTFKRMKQWEDGDAIRQIPNISKEKYQTWLPDHAQLYTLMGIKIRLRDILEHYASGACGERLQFAARWYAWGSSFDDEEKKSRQEALQFTKMHGMNEKDANEHMKMVEERLIERRKTFEKEFKEFLESYFPPLEENFDEESTAD